jgi:hypothetical protein
VWITTTPSGQIFFFCQKSRRKWAVGGGICSPEWVVGGGIWVHLVAYLLIWCFDLILNLCIFLKRLMCQFMSGGQKAPPLCHDRMATTFKVKCFTAHTMGYLQSWATDLKIND